MRTSRRGVDYYTAVNLPLGRAIYQGTIIALTTFQISPLSNATR
jgi:hypothetical protein